MTSRPASHLVLCPPLLQPRSEVVGRNCRFLQGPGTDPAAVQQLREALAAQPPRPVTVTLLNYRKDGRPFWNSLHISPLRDAGGGDCLVGLLVLDCEVALGCGQHDRQSLTSLRRATELQSRTVQLT